MSLKRRIAKFEKMAKTVGPKQKSMDDRAATHLRDLLKRMVSAGCEEASEIDGDISCRYCYAYLSGGEAHEDDCPFIEAKEIAEQP